MHHMNHVLFWFTKATCFDAIWQWEILENKGKLNVKLWRTWESTENVGKNWKDPENSREVWKTLKSCEKLWKVLENLEKLWKLLVYSGEFGVKIGGAFGKIREKSGKRWKTKVSFGKLQFFPVFYWV